MTINRIDSVPTQYSKGVLHADVIYVAGLIADNWDRDIVGQAGEIFAQLDHILGKFGSDKSRLLSLTVYIKTFDDYADFKATYAAWIDHDNLPARATVRADLLDPRLRLEIQATAARPSQAASLAPHR